MGQRFWARGLALLSLLAVPCVALAEAGAPEPSVASQPQNSPAEASARSRGARKRLKLAVLDVKTSGNVESQRGETLTTLIASEASSYDVDVIGGPDLRAMVGFERQRQVLGCQDASCLAEIGGALGVDYLLVANVSDFGNTWIITETLLEVGKSRAVKRTNGRTETIAGLLDAAVAATNELMGEIFTRGGAPVARTSKPESAAPASQPAAGRPATAASAAPASAPAAATAPAVTAAAESRRSGSGWVPWAVAGAGAVAAGAGGYLLMQARSTYDVYQRSQAAQGREGVTEAEARSAETQAKVGVGLLGAGGALLLGGVVWHFLSPGAPESAPRVAATVGSRSAGLVCSGTF